MSGIKGFVDVTNVVKVKVGNLSTAASVELDQSVPNASRIEILDEIHY
jgi:hypothetical protein